MGGLAEAEKNLENPLAGATISLLACVNTLCSN
jgi:hypothetical protein